MSIQSKKALVGCTVMPQWTADAGGEAHVLLLWLAADYRTKSATLVQPVEVHFLTYGGESFYLLKRWMVRPKNRNGAVTRHDVEEANISSFRSRSSRAASRDSISCLAVSNSRSLSCMMQGSQRHY